MSSLPSSLIPSLPTSSSYTQFYQKVHARTHPDGIFSPITSSPSIQYLHTQLPPNTPPTYLDLATAESTLATFQRISAIHKQILTHQLLFLHSILPTTITPASLPSTLEPLITQLKQQRKHSLTKFALERKCMSGLMMVKREQMIGDCEIRAEEDLEYNARMWGMAWLWYYRSLKSFVEYDADVFEYAVTPEGMNCERWEGHETDQRYKEALELACERVELS